MEIPFAKVARQSTLNEVTEDLQLVGESECVLARFTFFIEWLFVEKVKDKHI